MTVPLCDLPGGADLIPILVMAANDMALAFCGCDAEAVRAHLDHALANLQRGIANEIGPADAAKIVGALKRATMAQKKALEAKGTGRA